MLDVDVRLDADAAVTAIKRLADRLDNLDEFLRSNELADWWYRRQSGWFASGDIPANAVSTERRKGHARGLVDTGAMLESSRSNQPFNLGGGDATLGLRKGTPSYAWGLLNLTGPRGAPSREAVPDFDADEIADLRAMIRDWLTEVVNGAS